MKIAVDPKEGTAEFALPAKAYAERSLEIAAMVFAKRAEVYAAAGRGSTEVTLKAKGAGAGEAELRALAGEFLNELLNQEYRELVGRFNRKLTDLVVTQALFSARGGQNPPEQADESSPEFKAEVKKMMAEAEEEIRRTMPKKIAPKGIPLSLPKDERG